MELHDRIRDHIAPARERLLAHPLYGRLRDLGQRQLLAQRGRGGRECRHARRDSVRNAERIETAQLLAERAPDRQISGMEPRHVLARRRRPLELADDLVELKTICHCGRKATMVVRKDAQGQALRDGAQVQIGGNETYVSLCRRHWREATGDPASPPLPLR